MAETGERVLVVEDDESARLGLVELVRTWGYVAEEATDGEDALDKIETFRPAIVLTDLVMPRKTGLELLRALSDRLNEITVILLTAQGSVESAVDAMRDGAYDYLTKPVDPQRLKILLDRVLERQGQRREVQVLRRHLPHLAAVYVGENWRFGRDRAGDVALLIAEAKKAGLSVYSAPRLNHNGAPISSRTPNELAVSFVITPVA